MSTNPSTFLSGPNAPFIEELYARYLEQPNSVDPSWRKFFSDLQDESEIILNDIRGASWAPRERAVEIAREDGQGNGHDEAAPVRTARPQDLKRAARDSLRVMMLIRAYRVRGHLEASLDPLDLKPRAKHADLDPRTLGFTEADMDREIYIDNVLGYEGATLRQIVHVLRQTYCGTIGVDYQKLVTTEPYHTALGAFLDARSRRKTKPCWGPTGASAYLRRWRGSMMPLRTSASWRCA